MGPKLATVSLVLLTLFANSLQSPPSSSTIECPPYHNGSIAGNSCSQEYFKCVNGVRQAATCSEGNVFFEDGCIPAEQSPECQIADDTEDEPYEQFDCLSRPDGLHSVGCTNSFVNCVAGQAYEMYCPDDLVFNAKTSECQETCDDDDGSQDDAATTTTPSPSVYPGEDDGEGYDEGSGETEGYYEPQATTEEPDTVDFDCSGLDNGNYADGCSDVFYTCANGVAFRSVCPQGTVYNSNQNACDYDCTAATTTTTTPSYVPTTTTAAPTTQADEPKYTSTPQDDSWKTTTSGWEESTTTSGWETTTPGFDDVTTTRAPIVCQEGQVSSFGMCSSRFNRCQNNAVRAKQCPVNTLFESSLVMCVFDLPQCLPVTIPPTPTYNSNGYASYGPPADTIVSPFDENVRLKPKFDRRRKYHHGPIQRPGYGNSYGNAPSYGNTVLENPFFIPRHHPYRHRGGYRHRGHRRPHYGPHVDSPFFTRFHGRAALNDQFKDHRRVKMGKINYEARDVVGNKRFLMDDGFDGRKARFLTSDIQQVFPEARHSKRRLGPREDPDGYKDDKTFAAKDLFGATRRKRSAYYGAQQYGQQQYTQITARQAQVNKDCQQYTTPTFLTFGDCFDQFIYCSGNGLNRMAACPVGETFNKALRACSETCGVVAPVVTSTAATQTGDDSTWSATTTGSWSSNDDVTTFTTSAPSSFESYTTTQSSWNDESTTTQSSWNADDVSTDSYGTPSEDATTKAPVGDQCSYVSSGLFAIGCSQKYIQCSHGAAMVRQCPASLYFNQESQTCTFRDKVKDCQSTDNDSVYSTPGQDQTTTSGYGNGYGASDDSTTTSGYGNNYGPSDDQTTTSGYRGGYGSSNDQTTTSGYETNYGESNDQPSTTTSGYGLPSDDQTSTTSGYENTYEPSEDQATTYQPSPAPYKPSVSEDQQDEPVNACTGLSDGSHGQGCSSSYIICKYGRLVKSLICPLGEGYDPSVQMCRTFSQIPAQACDQQETTTDSGLVQTLPYQTLADVLSTTTTTVGYDEKTTDSYVNVPSDDSTTTTASYGEEETSDDPYDGYTTTTPAADATTTTTDSYNRGAYDVIEEEEEDVGYEQKCIVGSRASKGFCVQEYLECTSTGFVEKSCRVGTLFDSHSNRCVARISCGKEAIRDAIKDVIATTTAAPSKLDGRCAHVEGDAKFALSACHDVYLLCSHGAAQLQKCGRNLVFSNAKLECVSRESSYECNMASNQPVKSYYNHHGQSAFCDGKADGLYGNKKDCSAILQCFGGDLFEHSSCPSNLAFNDVTGTCDYPQKVSGCENHGRTEGVCTEHGSFIADVDDCKVFYRCVWGRKVVMKCPSGTVFNPLLSVCDWPSAVPSCSGGSSSPYGTSSSNDDNSGY
ncbi:unnamed protein product [Caenorhabditis brenneri]